MLSVHAFILWEGLTSSIENHHSMKMLGFDKRLHWVTSRNLLSKKVRKMCEFWYQMQRSLYWANITLFGEISKITAFGKDHGKRRKSRKSRLPWFRDFLLSLSMTIDQWILRLISWHLLCCVRGVTLDTKPHEAAAEPTSAIPKPRRLSF